MDRPIKGHEARIIVRSKVEAGSRIQWIDVAKGIGILLVVFGHMLRGLVNAEIVGPNSMIRLLDAWIYSFHMPLFFFVSGLFLHRAVDRGFGNFLRDRVCTIIYPYVVWSTVTLLIKGSLGSLVNHQRDILELPRIFVQPIEQYWFLYALLLGTVWIAVLLRLGLGPWSVFLLMVILYPGISLLPLSEWAPLNDMRYFAIYIALGVASAGSLEALSTLRSFMLIAVVALGFTGITVFAALPGISGRALLSPLVAILGTMSVFSLSVLLMRHWDLPALQSLGRMSLEIYLVHTIASAGARIVLSRGLQITDPGLHILAGLLAGVGLPVALATFLRCIDFRWAFSIPNKQPG